MKRSTTDLGLLAVPIVLAWASAWLGGAPGTGTATGTCPNGAAINVVAHEDDDLLFLSPDLLRDVEGGLCIRTVFLTSGEAGRDATYVAAREAGSRAAYATMTRVPNAWTIADAGVPGHPIPLMTLAGAPRVSLAFMRLPDGNVDGTGFARHGFQSLQKLWDDQVVSVTTVDARSAYTRQEVISTLGLLMKGFMPSTVRTQDFVGTFGDGDHSDHYAAGLFAQAARDAHQPGSALVGYQGYGTLSRPANVAGADLASKRAAFLAAAAHDDKVCVSVPSCRGSEYWAWLPRQYTVAGAPPRHRPNRHPRPATRASPRRSR